MESRIEILIDASGSMGREVINGEQFLLLDGSSRTDLVKKVLAKNIKPLIKNFDKVSIRRFRIFYKRNSDGSLFLNENGHYGIYKNKVSEYIYNYGPYLNAKFNGTLNKLQNPPAGGTPLFKMLVESYIQPKNQRKQIIIITDGDDNDEPDFDLKFINKVNKLKLDLPIHFIGIAQTDEAKTKCLNIANATNGSYVNIKAINYDEQALNKFLFPVKSKVMQQQIKTAVQQTVSNPDTANKTNIKTKLKVPKELDKKALKDIQISKDIVNEVAPNNELVHQVERNSRALSQISIQLENIVGLLQGFNNDQIIIHENPEHNNRIGRKAEARLFKKLKTFNWEVDWLNEKEESYKSYDFYVENKEHKTYYECKGTADNLNRFHLTDKEWSFYLANRGHYRLCFVQHVDGAPVIYRFMDLLDDLEQGRLKLHHSVNHNVKANSITFFVDLEKCEIF